MSMSSTLPMSPQGCAAAERTLDAGSLAGAGRLVHARTSPTGPAITSGRPVGTTRHHETSAGSVRHLPADLAVMVVIPTFNEAENIRRVVESVAAQAEPSTIIVVCDGMSTDGTADIVRSMQAEIPNLHLLNNPARVQSAAINLAASHFAHRAGILIRCDAHCEYPANFIDAVRRDLCETGASSVVVRLDTFGVSPFQRAVAYVSNRLIGSGGSRHRSGGTAGFVDHGHHAGFLLADFLAVGGYDASFSHNEDAELDCRLKKAGGLIYFDPDIKLRYLPRDTAAKLFMQYFRYGCGRAKTAMRHPDCVRLRQVAVPTAIGSMFVALAAAPWQPAAVLLPAGYAACLLTSMIAIAIEERDGAALLSPLAAAAMHVGWALGFLAKLFGQTVARIGRIGEK